MRYCSVVVMLRMSDMWEIQGRKAMSALDDRRCCALAGKLTVSPQYLHLHQLRRENLPAFLRKLIDIVRSRPVRLERGFAPVATPQWMADLLIRFVMDFCIYLSNGIFICLRGQIGVALRSPQDLLKIFVGSSL